MVVVFVLGKCWRLRTHHFALVVPLSVADGGKKNRRKHKRLKTEGDGGGDGGGGDGGGGGSGSD